MYLSDTECDPVTVSSEIDRSIHGQNPRYKDAFRGDAVHLQCRNVCDNTCFSNQDVCSTDDNMFYENKAAMFPQPGQLVTTSRSVELELLDGEYEIVLHNLAYTGGISFVLETEESVTPTGYQLDASIAAWCEAFRTQPLSGVQFADISFQRPTADSLLLDVIAAGCPLQALVDGRSSGLVASGSLPWTNQEWRLYAAHFTNEATLPLNVINKRTYIPHATAAAFSTALNTWYTSPLLNWAKFLNVGVPSLDNVTKFQLDLCVDTSQMCSCQGGDWNADLNTCRCRPGWFGATCSSSCRVRDCSGHGVCYEKNDYDDLSGRCVCDDGWDPDTSCGTRFTCASDSECRGSGTSDVFRGGGVCKYDSDCPGGAGFVPHELLVGGVCVLDPGGSTGRCHCPTHLAGDFCTMLSDNHPNCNTVSRFEWPEGKADPTNNGYAIACANAAGISGTASTAAPEGTCHTASGTCACPNGYSGSRCDFRDDYQSLAVADQVTSTCANPDPEPRLPYSLSVKSDMCPDVVPNATCVRCEWDTPSVCDRFVCQPCYEDNDPEVLGCETVDEACLADLREQQQRQQEAEEEGKGSSEDSSDFDWWRSAGQSDDSGGGNPINGGDGSAGNNGGDHGNSLHGSQNHSSAASGSAGSGGGDGDGGAGVHHQNSGSTASSTGSNATTAHSNSNVSNATSASNATAGAEHGGQQSGAHVSGGGKQGGGPHASGGSATPDSNASTSPQQDQEVEDEEEEEAEATEEEDQDDGEGGRRLKNGTTSQDTTTNEDEDEDSDENEAKENEAGAEDGESPADSSTKPDSAGAGNENEGKDDEDDEDDEDGYGGYGDDEYESAEEAAFEAQQAASGVDVESDFAVRKRPAICQKTGFSPSFGNRYVYNFTVDNFPGHPNPRANDAKPGGAGQILDRYIGHENRIIAGVRVKARVNQQKQCSVATSTLLGDLDAGVVSRRGGLFSSCRHDAGDTSDAFRTAPWGVDPVFVDTSSLADYTIFRDRKTVGSFYPTSERRNHTTISEFLQPFGFHPVRKVASDSADYGAAQVWFDVRMLAPRAAQFMQYLRDGFYLTDGVNDIEVEFLTWNGHLEMFTLVTCTFTSQTDGTLKFDTDVNVFSVDIYHENRSFRFVCEWLLILLNLCEVLIELRQWVQMYRQARRRDGANLGAAMCAYFESGFNVVDVATLVLLFVYVGRSRAYFYEQLMPFAPAPTYDVYADLHANARFMRMRDTQDDLGMNRATDAIQAVFDRANAIVTEKNNLSGMVIAIVLLQVVRLLKVLDFQPKLALVTKTIVNAGWELFHFILVFFIQTVCFAIGGHIAFGVYAKAFSTFGGSLVTCVMLFMGEIGIHDEMVETEMSTWWYVFFFLFMLVQFFVLLNILLAILVDAYIVVRSGAATSHDIFTDLYEVLAYLAYVCLHPRSFVSDGALSQALAEAIQLSTAEQTTMARGNDPTSKENQQHRGKTTNKDKVVPVGASGQVSAQVLAWNLEAADGATTATAPAPNVAAAAEPVDLILPKTFNGDVKLFGADETFVRHTLDDLWTRRRSRKTRREHGAVSLSPDTIVSELFSRLGQRRKAADVDGEGECDLHVAEIYSFLQKTAVHRAIARSASSTAEEQVPTIPATVPSPRPPSTPSSLRSSSHTLQVVDVHDATKADGDPEAKATR